MPARVRGLPGEGLLLREDKDPAFVRNQHVDFPVLIDIPGGDLSADTAVIVDEVGDEFGAAFSVPL
jgi:hypothetical protein